MELCEPPHFGFGRPRRAAASANPNCVGAKNRFVVAWLTNQNCQAGVFGKFPTAAAAGEDEPLVALPVALAVELEVQAASSADAAAVALTRPVPASSRPRVGPSCMLSVCMASSTLGLIFFMGPPCSPSRRNSSAHPRPRWPAVNVRTVCLIGTTSVVTSLLLRC